MSDQRKTRFLFFSGKGGVGKTSMACATAVHLANEGKKTLIVTTDPASNLADVFEQEIGHREIPIGGVPGLWAMEIDPDRATEEYRERVIGPMRPVMPAEIIRVIEEQFRSPCTTEIAAFDRFVDFMDDTAYDVVVFDTAPTGHTIRLLELPVDWSKHIEESATRGGQTCMGPVEAIQSSKAKYDRAISLLRDGDRTAFVFVVLPEQTPIFEADRAMKELAGIGIRTTRLIVNGIIPPEEAANPLFSRRREMQERYLGEIASIFPIPTKTMYLMAREIRGAEILAGVGNLLYGAGGDIRFMNFARPASLQAAEIKPLPTAGTNASELLVPGPAGRRLLFFAGKGGVGKTVMASATAVRLAEMGHRTLLVSTDPASHLSQVFEQEIGSEITPVDGQPGLCAARVDQKKAAQEYRERILTEARGKFTDGMIEAMKEELESPCTEEMAAFEKFVRFAALPEYDVIIFDTAPTGHTLRLLELPMEWDRQIEVMVSAKPGTQTHSETKARYDRIIETLKSPDLTTFVFVVYPEHTPVVEAFRASQDLRAAGIATSLVIANQVLPVEGRTTPFYANRYELQRKYLDQIEERFGVPVLVMPLLEGEIRGLRLLRRAAALLYGDRIREVMTAR